MGWSYPNNWQPLPYFNLTLRSDAREVQNSRRGSGVLRASRTSGPSGSTSRKSSAPFTDHACRVRAARSPGGLKALRASPAVLRTAKATPIHRLPFY